MLGSYHSLKQTEYISLFAYKIPASSSETLNNNFMSAFMSLKDGAYFCYCAYVLRIWRYTCFQWVLLTNTGIFLRGLKLSRESRTQQVLLVSKMNIGGNRAFFRDNKASIKKKNAIHCFVFYGFLE